MIVKVFKQKDMAGVWSIELIRENERPLVKTYNGAWCSATTNRVTGQLADFLARFERAGERRRERLLMDHFPRRALWRYLDAVHVKTDDVFFGIRPSVSQCGERWAIML